MIVATITGNLGKDAEMRHAGDSDVLSFGVASTKKDRRGEVTTWVECSVWGKRGAALAPYLSKGTRVTVVGELSTREHNGKTYLQLRVDHLDFSGPSRSEGSRRAAPVDDYAPAALPGDDDLPF